MNAALIYRARSRWLIWAAFGCAIAIHLTAIVIAENRSKFVMTDLGPSAPEVIGIDDPSPSMQEPEMISPPEQVPPTADDESFPQESATPPPIRPRKKTPIPPVARSTGTGTASAVHAGSAKALTMYAPRPAYPYEARRGQITGSGVAELTVNSGIGSVIDVRMAQSTGSVILDMATVEALRKWRFKPGVAANIQVPITYTLTGASY
jgi:TonB family protein